MGRQPAAPVPPAAAGTRTLRPHRGAPGFFAYVQAGPWGVAAGRRLAEALHDLVRRVAALAHAVGVVVFGSYARGEAGASSDLDLLVLFDTDAAPERLPEGRAALTACGEVEAAHRLPMHLAPLLASVRRPGDLGGGLLRAVLADGIVLYGSLPHLAALAAPANLAPMAVLAYSLGTGATREKVRLYRRLFGYTTAAGRRMPGLVQPPGRRLARGAVVVPLAQRGPVVRALQEAGALYSEVPVWVPAGAAHAALAIGPILEVEGGGESRRRTPPATPTR